MKSQKKISYKAKVKSKNLDHWGYEHEDETKI